MNFYLNKYSYCKPQLLTAPDPETGIIVVIPCFDEPELVRSLASLYNCFPPACNVEVITVINAASSTAEEIKSRNRVTFKTAKTWTEKHTDEKIKFHFIVDQELPPKHAGVGLARKIGMDEAVARFHKIKKDGIIVCFDADSTCDKTYLQAVEQHFSDHPSTPGCSIYFEHPLSGSEFVPGVYNAITEYELFLRYYKQSLAWCGLPFAFHTIGSSMAVRSSAYQKQGGMNRRKAGEDFYFLQKIIALGGFAELQTTKVIPSPRPSHRVPFGTGKAVSDKLASQQHQLRVYNFKTFEVIREFISGLEESFKKGKWIKSPVIDEHLTDFTEKNNWQQKLDEMLAHSAGYEGFKSRFFTWFDAFFVLRLVHRLRDVAFPDEPIDKMCNELLKRTGKREGKNSTELLFYFREWDKKK